MATSALLMFNLDEAEGILRNVRRLRSAVDEVVVVDSSSPEGYHRLLAAVEPYAVCVHRVLPLGHVDPLRPFGVSKVKSDRVLLLDADEEPSPALVADLRDLAEHDAYVVPRYEEALRAYTFHLRLFRRDAVGRRAGGGAGAALFTRRYALAKAAFLEGLPEEDRRRVAAIAAEIQCAGGLFPYLGLADPSDVERLTATFAWDRPGLAVYEELLRVRHERGVPADWVGAASSVADNPSAERPGGAAQVSVVIPTHDRPERLRSLLSSLQSAATENLERVIIVDDSASPTDWAREFPGLPVQHLVLDRRAFISRAKNRGWRAARSPLVFFIDDDNVVTRETMERPLALMASAADVAAVVPSVLYKERPDLVWVYATPLAPGRWGHTLLGRNRPRNPALENRRFDTDALPNAAPVRREAPEAVGGVW